MKVPLTKPFFDHEELNLVKEVLDSGWVTQGPKVQEFEKRLTQFIRAKNVIAVSNCTTALHLCMLISQIKQ